MTNSMESKNCSSKMVGLYAARNKPKTPQGVFLLLKLLYWVGSCLNSQGHVGFFAQLWNVWSSGSLFHAVWWIRIQWNEVEGVHFSTLNFLKLHYQNPRERVRGWDNIWGWYIVVFVKSFWGKKPRSSAPKHWAEGVCPTWGCPWVAYQSAPRRWMFVTVGCSFRFESFVLNNMSILHSSTMCVSRDSTFTGLLRWPVD